MYMYVLFFKGSLFGIGLRDTKNQRGLGWTPNPEIAPRNETMVETGTFVAVFTLGNLIIPGFLNGGAEWIRPSTPPYSNQAPSSRHQILGFLSTKHFHCTSWPCTTHDPNVPARNLGKSKSYATGKGAFARTKRIRKGHHAHAESDQVP